MNKEKLLICCKIVGTRLKDLHAKLDKKKGINADRATIGKIKTEERSFILRSPKQITPAYLKYVHKEEWYQKALSKYPQFKKDKRLQRKDEQMSTMWHLIKEICTELLE